MNQDDISVLHGNGHVKVRIPGINSLDGKSILRLETVIVGFFVVGGIVPRIMAMGGKLDQLPLGHHSVSHLSPVMLINACAAVSRLGDVSDAMNEGQWLGV